MWIVCKAGFFNVICQDDDLEKGLLTVKARSRKDLENLTHFIPFHLPIEESRVTDYRFRMKAEKEAVMGAFKTLILEIDYPKTKPVLKKARPHREMIHLAVWSDLYRIQEIDEEA